MSAAKVLAPETQQSRTATERGLAAEGRRQCSRTTPVRSLAGHPIPWLEARLRGLARKVAPGCTSAELDDLVQCGLEVACQLAPLYCPQRGATFFTFLYGRARGAMLDAATRERSASARGEASAAEEPSSPSAEDLLFAQAEETWTQHAMAASIGMLCEDHRRLVILCAVEGLSIAEAARHLRMDYEKARYRYWKAIAQL